MSEDKIDPLAEIDAAIVALHRIREFVAHALLDKPARAHEYTVAFVSPSKLKSEERRKDADWMRKCVRNADLETRRIVDEIATGIEHGRSRWPVDAERKDGEA